MGEKMKRYIPFFMISVLVLICHLNGDNAHNISPQTEKHEVTVRLILVDVIAIDKYGNVVKDLTKEEFELYEGGKRVPINSLDFVSLEKETSKAPQLEVNKEEFSPPLASIRKGRLFVVFDSINTIKRMLDRSRDQIIEKLISLINLGGEVMVLELKEKHGIQMLQSLSSNEELIRQAVNKASGSIWVEKSADTLSIPNVVRIKEIEEGKPSIIRKSLREMYQFETRNRFEKSLSGLLSVMNMIKDYPGRKSVLLVSGGFPSISFDYITKGVGIEDDVLILTQMQTAKIMDPFKVLHKDKHLSGDEIFHHLIQYANSHNISFYTLDPDNYLRYVLPDIAYDNFQRQLATPDDLRINKDEVAVIKRNELKNLKYLAEDTGGSSFQGATKFERFQKYLNRDIASYYVLSYYPKRKKADGKYHKIKVKVKRPGIKIKFRKGYFDYKPEHIESLTFASASTNPDLFKQIDFQARTVPFIKGKDKYILWINMALPVQGLILGDDPNKEQKIVKVNFWVDDPQDKNAINARVDIPIDLSPSSRAKLKNIRYFGYNTCSQELKLKHGQYRMIYVVYDEDSDHVGTVEHLLEVPTLKVSETGGIINAVFGRLVKSERGGRSFAISQKDATLQVGDFKFYPMGSNQFNANENVSLFLQVNMKDEKVKLDPQLVLLQNGRIHGNIPFETIKESWNKKAKIRNIIYKLNFANFSPGEYILDIRSANPIIYKVFEKRVLINIL